ncbi:MAG TPA: type I-U CRISPR-associated RAMP protein Csb1/Cas7u [Acidimicrobiales bacterium]
MKLTADVLVEACDDLAGEAGVTVTTELEPLGGPGAPVKPATYEGGRFQVDDRWWGDGDEPVKAIVIDNEPSQANRLEAALEALRPELGLPEIVLDLSGIGELPPHLPKRLSGFRFPHRHADAYLRDALLDGRRFPTTEVGQAIFSATADAAAPLLEWFPQALLFGFWQSHLGRKRSQAKLARSWSSEIVGYKPAATGTKRFGLKGDPLNLSVTEALTYHDDDQLAHEWSFTGADKSKARGGKATEALSNVGHGQVLVREADAAPAGVSFEAISQRSTVSLAALRRVRTGVPGADAAARALLVALGLVAHVTAFGRSFSLRSGCELRPRSAAWQWLGATAEDDRDIDPRPTVADAVDLFRACVAKAEDAGLPVGARWPTEPLVVQPNDALAQAIRKSWPQVD